jgi:hypothetical protein
MYWIFRVEVYPKQVTSKKQAESAQFSAWKACSLALRMEIVQSSEKQVNFYWTTQHHLPENSTLQNLKCIFFRTYLELAFTVLSMKK